MELTKTERPAQVKYSGRGGLVATAGQSITIETTPVGEELLDEEVPANKEWLIQITVDIIESDA